MKVSKTLLKKINKFNKTYLYLNPILNNEYPKLLYTFKKLSFGNESVKITGLSLSFSFIAEPKIHACIAAIKCPFPLSTIKKLFFFIVGLN